MRRFRFRLDKVLKLRAHRERAARRTLAESLSALRRLADDLERLDHNLAVCREDDQATSAAALARALEAGLMHRRYHTERDMEAATQHVNHAQRSYQEARIRHRAMSNLRSRRLDSWRLQVQAEDQAEFDEMARTRFLLRKARR
jgi:flagellar export protein FliJ